MRVLIDKHICCAVSLRLSVDNCSCMKQFGDIQVENPENLLQGGRFQRVGSSVVARRCFSEMMWYLSKIRGLDDLSDRDNLVLGAEVNTLLKSRNINIYIRCNINERSRQWGKMIFETWVSGIPPIRDPAMVKWEMMTMNRLIMIIHISTEQ